MPAGGEINGSGGREGEMEAEGSCPRLGASLGSALGSSGYGRLGGAGRLQL